MPPQIDPETSRNIQKARTVRGLAPSIYQVMYSNFTEWLDELTKKRASQTALIFINADLTRTEITYRELNQRVNRIANFLCMKLGVRQGIRVATMTDNQPDTLMTYLAVLKVGAVLCPINFNEDNTKINALLQNAGVKVVIVQDEFTSRILEITKSIPGFKPEDSVIGLKHIVKVGKIKDEGTILFNESVVTSSPLFSPKEMTSLDDDAVIIYTAGVTGLPKGVVLSQYNLLVNADNLVRWHNLDETVRTLCVLPMYPVNEFVTSFLAPFYAAGTTVMLEKFDPSKFWQIVAEEKITLVNLTPTLLQQLAEAKGNKLPKNSTLKYLICGEGFLNPDLVKEFDQTYGVRIIQGYGLSETSGYATSVPTNLNSKEYQLWMQESQPPTIGQPFYNVEIGILDNKGAEVPAEQTGEIVLRGHSIMKGYYKRPEANSDAFKYGWFHTRDKGFYKVDQKGRKFFFISGRLKDIINRAGMKISPSEIDKILLEIPGVKWGLTVSFPNKWTGEEIGAYIVPEQAEAVTENDVIDYCQEKLTFFKRPKVVVWGKEVLGETPRHLLRQQLQSHFQNWAETQFEDK